MLSSSKKKLRCDGCQDWYVDGDWKRRHNHSIFMRSKISLPRENLWFEINTYSEHTNDGADCIGRVSDDHHVVDYRRYVDDFSFFIRSSIS
ncbi:unnamed protein product [Rotaria sp. Silwood2]|nr:unnamed protein product [Rotaria sp. Silwood2]CAF3964938.1 unnamed protein product [Rotaria sp. Silwood2]CAF4052933.1 unnamed protein product [Rotaria sp. Silwood2]